MGAFNDFINDYVPDHPIAIQKIAEAYFELVQYIPQEYRLSREELPEAVETGLDALKAMSMPFYEILTDLPEAIYNFAGTLFHRAARDEGLFEELREQLIQNENIASGI